MNFEELSKKEKDLEKNKETGEPSCSEVLDFAKQLEIDPMLLINQSLNEKGNIKDAVTVFEDLFSQELKKKFKTEENFKDYPWINLWDWKVNEYQKKLIEKLNDKNKKEDLEKLIMVQSIKDIACSGSDNDDSEFPVWPNTQEVITGLIEIFKKENFTILEKIIFKKTIYDLSKIDDYNNSFGYIHYKGKKSVKELKRELGIPEKIDYLNNKKFDRFKFEFDKEQEDIIRSDAKITGDGRFENPHIKYQLAPDIIGVYTINGKLVGCKKLNDIKEDKSNILDDVSDIRLIKNKNTDFKKELALFKIVSSLYFRDYIKKNMEVDMSILDIPTQFYFLDFIQNKTEKELSSVVNFIKKSSNEADKNNKLKTFLSIEHGGKEMGDKILELGEKLSEDIAKKVFAKYGEIIDSVDKTEEKVRNLYKEDDISNVSSEVFESIKETLLKRGVKLLSNLADNIKGNTEINEGEILAELEDVKTETIILGESFVELYKEGIKVPIENITKIEKISTQDLTDKQKEEILKVYENGRPKETYENEQHIKLLREEFKETLNNKDTFVFNIRFNDKIIAFATFDQINKDTLHIGGLTFIDDVRKPAIAVAVMNAVMKEFGNFNIKALVHSKNKILPMYQKRFGFKITHELNSEEELKENAGELYYEIERAKNSLENITLEKAA